MRPLLDVVTTVCIGLLIGTEFAVAVFINPILRMLGPRDELRAIGLLAANLGAAMPVWSGVIFLLTPYEKGMAAPSFAANSRIARNSSRGPNMRKIGLMKTATESGL